MQEDPRLSHLEKAPLGQLIAATRRRLKQAAWKLLAPMDLTPQQYWILMVLLEHGPHSLHDLARKVWIDDPTACRIVKALVDRELLISGPDPEHGRRIQIQLGPKAHGMEKELRAVSTRFRATLEKDLEAKEKEQVRRLLLKIIGNMDELDAGAEAPVRRSRRAS